MPHCRSGLLYQSLQTCWILIIRIRLCTSPAVRATARRMGAERSMQVSVYTPASSFSSSHISLLVSLLTFCVPALELRMLQEHGTEQCKREQKALLAGYTTIAFDT